MLVSLFHCTIILKTFLNVMSGCLWLMPVFRLVHTGPPQYFSQQSKKVVSPRKVSKLNLCSIMNVTSIRNYDSMQLMNPWALSMHPVDNTSQLDCGKVLVLGGVTGSSWKTVPTPYTMNSRQLSASQHTDFLTALFFSERLQSRRNGLQNQPLNERIQIFSRMRWLVHWIRSLLIWPIEIINRGSI